MDWSTGKKRKEREGTEEMKAGKTGITRQQYKDLKKKDHRQVNDLLARLWMDGYSEGMAAKKVRVTPEEIEREIRKIRGMGETRVNAVMGRICKLYEEAGNAGK